MKHLFEINDNLIGRIHYGILPPDELSEWLQLANRKTSATATVHELDRMEELEKV